MPTGTPLTGIPDAQLVATVTVSPGQDSLDIGQTVQMCRRLPWTRLSLRSGTCTDAPVFTGVGAVLAFDAAGDSTYMLRGKVPVENGGSSRGRKQLLPLAGIRDGRELMTPVLDGGGAHPSSRITIASLADEGYTVNSGAPDGYSLPAAAPAWVAEGAKGPRFWLGDDILPTPRYLVHPDGRIGQVAPVFPRAVDPTLGSEEEARRFVRERLETYERMWDGCGCKVEFDR